ncbi:FAS-associated factor 1 [Copidosoma floridanum]|uniref:FAS-associated factor 1 n=1 Tax=Copidosoma floridanum TaxID=29053 RepID=UPI0006C95331|nr:FAS-associated factor 1 [Copidosoma floridanum]
MDAVNRDVILADFQACTDIDDVGLAILHLETSNWDLLAAINNAMPQNSQQLPSEMNRDVEMIDEIKPRQPIVCSPSEDIVEVMPGTSSNNSRMNTRVQANLARTKTLPKQLMFTVHYQSSVYPVDIKDTCTLGDLKILIYSLTKVAPCQQQLHGWKKEPKDDDTVLKSLDLPRENDLYMSSVSEIGDTASPAVKLSDRAASTFRLKIKDEVKCTTYDLNFPGTTTIQDLKSNIYTLNEVPVRYQVWKGWPPQVKNDAVTLAGSGIPISGSTLSVSKLSSTKETKKELVNLIDTDSSPEEDNDDFEDVPESFQMDDDIFIDQVQTSKIQHLIPDHVDDEVVGTLHFLEEYKKRYGPNHPNFFTGTLEDAMAESCSKPPRDRKLLAVYLHHDNSILANVFCTQLLGFETVLQLLSANFVVWGWDCTYESNKQRFLTSIQQLLGLGVHTTVRGIDVDTMPVMIIIMRSRSNTDIFTIVHGNVGVNELLTNLIEAVDVFQEQRQNDVEFEDERQARERVKEEQDQAYYESLAADRAKEKRKQLQEKIEKEKKERAENERLADQAKKEARRLAVESCLTDEPSEDAPGVLKIKIRLPSGKFLERRFTKNAKLQTVLNFLIVKNYPTEDYKLISWPRRDLTSIDTNQTLNELNFSPQETLILEER